MSIQQLPDDVVAQIKSSTTITSLNGVITGLIKNSLDADATKITITVEYAKGNCSVQDNGSGILPAEFAPDGGLGKLYYTSRFPVRPNIHGSSGTFLASVAALSLLTITSHHEGHRSHNSIQIHNSKVTTRNTPALPEQRILNYSHGTRVTVCNLFGSMPVRVKQRAAVADKTTTAREWEQLKLGLVALQLSWKGKITIVVRDCTNQQSVIIRNSETIDESLVERVQRSLLISRVSSSLYQAGLSEETDSASWVMLKASTGSLKVTGVVCRTPVATKRLQFISIGIQPLSNEYGSNVLYEEINRLFANSSFGVEEEIGEISEEERTRRAADRRYKTEGYTSRELKGRRGIDRWPKFHIRIDLDDLMDVVISHDDLDRLLDGRRNNLQTIVDVLRAMLYEFLKKHHFRPIYYEPKKRKSLARNGSQPSSRGSTPTLPSRPASRTAAISKDERIVVTGDLAASKLLLSQPHEQQNSYEPVYDGWSRVKSGRQTLNIFGNSETEDPASQALNGILDRTTGAEPKSPLYPPLFDAQGGLLRVPFPEAEEPDKDDCTKKQRSRSEDQQDAMRPDKDDGDITWQNPVTKQRSVIDARTGFVVTSQERVEVKRLTSSRPPRTRPLPPNRDTSPWISDLLSSWKNPVFEAAESRIPTAFDEAKLMGSMKSYSGNSHGCNCASSNPSSDIENRVSKSSLRSAEVIAQVDSKFIFVKVPLHPTLPVSGGSRGYSSLLVMVDQHAADERCRVEGLMAAYFTSSGRGEPRAVKARTETIHNSLQYEVSVHECALFERNQAYFEHWGIVYQLNKAGANLEQRNIRLPSFLKVTSLPPSIAERCRTEPRLFIDLLRHEVWKLEDSGRRHPHPPPADSEAFGDSSANLHWLSRFHGCPQGILDLINSRACRSAIMFNDVLSFDQCKDLLERLADCAFPFQCAHGRPSMVPLVDLGDQRMVQDEWHNRDGYGSQFKKWKATLNRTSD